MIWSKTLNCPREMPDVRLAIGPNAASVWSVNGERVIGIYGDRQTVIDDGAFGDGVDGQYWRPVWQEFQDESKAAFSLPSIQRVSNR
jgi:hypothetical protein